MDRTDAILLGSEAGGRGDTRAQAHASTGFPKTLFEAAGLASELPTRPARRPRAIFDSGSLATGGVGLSVLGSSSSGNCAVLRVGTAANYRLIMIDCGLSPLRTRKLLAVLGLDADRVAAIVLTHLHRDHFRETWLKRLPPHARFYVHERHRGVATRSGVLRRRTEMICDEPFDLLGLRVEARIAPHDDLGSMVLRFDAPASDRGASRSLGYATDLGCVPDRVGEMLAGVDVLAIESNYCERMQLASGRHRILIDRIMKDGGHLSNDQSAAAVRDLLPRDRVVLLHLSRQCNTPETAVACHVAAHGGGIHGAVVEAAPEVGPMPLVELSGAIAKSPSSS